VELLESVRSGRQQR